MTEGQTSVSTRATANCDPFNQASDCTDWPTRSIIRAVQQEEALVRLACGKLGRNDIEDGVQIEVNKCTTL